MAEPGNRCIALADALQVPGLVQGGLTIIIVRSSMGAMNYVRSLEKMGLRALFVDGPVIDQLEQTDNMKCNELDVLLFHSSSAHEKMYTFLANLQCPIAVLTIDSAERASRLSPKHYQKHYLGWARLHKRLRPRSLVCSTYVRSAEVLDDMHRIYDLSKSSSTIVKDRVLPNLSIDAVTLPRNHDKFATILRLLEKRSGTALILTGTELNAKTIAMKLQEEGYDAKEICLPSDKGERRRTKIAELLDASHEILCVPKELAIHLPLPKVGQIIWQCLAFSPQQFQAINSIACQDGGASLCTVLLSEQEIFNSMDIALAMAPSLHQLRIIMAEIFRGREVLKAGSSFVIEKMRVSYLADVETADLATLLNMLHDEGILDLRQTAYLHADPGPRLLQAAHRKLIHPREFDMVKALEENTGAPLETRPGMLKPQLDAFAASGLVQRSHEIRNEVSGHGLKVFSVIHMTRDFSQKEADDFLQKVSAQMREQTAGRITSRRQYLELFTTKRCFVASLAEILQLEFPSERKACGQCFFCVMHKPVAVTPLSQIEKPIDLGRLNSIVHSVPAQFAKDPRFLARIAIGKMTTRIKTLGLHNNQHIFGSMRLNSFEVCTLRNKEKENLSEALIIFFRSQWRTLGFLWLTSFARNRLSTKHLRNDLESQIPNLTSIDNMRKGKYTARRVLHTLGNYRHKNMRIRILDLPQASPV